MVSSEHALIDYFVSLQECRKLYNYSSVFAIVTALDSPFITRLSLTRQSVKKEFLEELKNLSSLTDISRNHKAYRDALPKASERQCLPIIGRVYTHILWVSSLTLRIKQLCTYVKSAASSTSLR